MTAGTSVSGAEAAIPVVLPWVHEAGTPYVDWLFGDASEARRVTAEWMARPTSELWIGRMRTWQEGDDIVGGYIALSGADVLTCRRADALAVVQLPGDRRARLSRLAAARDLLVPVDPEDFYLSRMGVAARWRGQGLGRRLLEDFLALGADGGHTRFRLDVSADKPAARALYERAGFAVVHERRSEEAAITYLAMVKEVR